MDVMLSGADAIADTVWLGGREDTQTVFDPMAAIVNESGGLAITFLGPLSLLFGMIGLVIVSAVLMMRSALLYLVAAFAPIVWASSVSPVMRGAGRRLMHVTVALVLAKPAIVLTLTVGMKLMANTLTPTFSDGAEISSASARGTLMTGFTCITMAGLSPWVCGLESSELAASAGGSRNGRSARGMPVGCRTQDAVWSSWLFCDSSQRSASIAAMQPEPAAVMAWR
ncbi:MAG TPA: hypothetical protein VE487_10740 [Ilumatobacter sp.]|nr:hypothetical protein [Ilumatobacter sp.]